MTFEPQNALETSLMEAGRSQAHLSKFMRDFLAAKVIFISRGRPGAGEPVREIRPRERLDIPHIKFEDELHIPVFSSLARVREFVAAPVRARRMDVPSFVKLTRRTPLLLNPGSAFGKQFLTWELEAMLDGTLWEMEGEKDDDAEAQQAINESHVRQDETPPPETIRTITNVLADLDNVKQAYWAVNHDPDAPFGPHAMLAVEADGDVERVIHAVFERIPDVVLPRKPLETIILNGESGWEDFFGSRCTPFYHRGAVS